MPIETTCPHCPAVYHLADHLRGRTVRCKNCQGAIVVGDSGTPRSQAKLKTPAGKGGKTQPKSRIVGLVPFLVLGPLMFLGLLVSPFAVWAARGTVVFALVVGFVGVGMAYWLGSKKGLAQEMDELGREYMGGAGVFFMQINYAFRWPRLFACWVSLQVLALLVAIAAGILIVTVHKGSNAPASPPPAVQTPNPIAPAPGPPRVTGDPEIDRLLADLADDQQPGNRIRAANRLAEMKPNRHRAAVAHRLAEVAEGTSEFGRGEAIKALAVWATPNEVPALIRLFRQAWLRDGAAKALRTVGPAAEKDLADLLNDADLGLRQQTIDLLKDIGTRRSVPALQSVVDKNDRGTRERAQAAIAAIEERGGQ